MSGSWVCPALWGGECGECFDTEGEGGEIGTEEDKKLCYGEYLKEKEKVT
jgi:hypothetical protein